MDKVLAGRYALEAEIARGAIGTVWRARDLTTGETVAAKVLLPETQQDPDVVKGLLAEAAILAELNHPGIVRARDVIANGLHALVMDLVEGEDVRQRLRNKGPFRPSEVAIVGAQIADALSAVHAAGIVHGDVKPGNVLLPSDGGPAKLGDFGVARRVQLPDTVTHATPEYVAPEVVAGAKPTPASDVYSFGMVLYEMACGRSPYRGGSVSDVIERHATCVPVRPEGMPAQLWRAIRRCVEHDPARRPSAEEVARDLRGVVPQLVGLPAPDPLPESATTYQARSDQPAAETKEGSESATSATPMPLWPSADQVNGASEQPVSAPSVTPFGMPPSGSPVSAPSSPGASSPGSAPSSSAPSSSAPSSVVASPVSAPDLASTTASTSHPGNPSSPASAPTGESGSVLDLFAGSAGHRTGDEPPTQMVGAVPVPEPTIATRPGRGRVVALVAVAASVVLFVGVGLLLLLWSDGDRAPSAVDDPSPAPTESTAPAPSESASPSSSASPETSPTGSPDQSSEPPSDDGGQGPANPGDGGDDSGGSVGGGDGSGRPGSGNGGRPGIGDPMPTIPGH